LYDLLALAKPELDLNARQKERVTKAMAELKAYRSRESLKSKALRNGYMDRLTLLVGQVRAGNKGNREIIAEGTRLLTALVKAGVITREEAQRVQKELH